MPPRRIPRRRRNPGRREGRNDPARRTPRRRRWQRIRRRRNNCTGRTGGRMAPGRNRRCRTRPRRPARIRPNPGCICYRCRKVGRSPGGKRRPRPSGCTRFAGRARRTGHPHRYCTGRTASRPASACTCRACGDGKDRTTSCVWHLEAKTDQAGQAGRETERGATGVDRLDDVVEPMPIRVQLLISGRTRSRTGLMIPGRATRIANSCPMRRAEVRGARAVSQREAGRSPRCIVRSRTTPHTAPA